MASKGLSGAAPVLEGYGLSCEHDLSLLVQEDLNTLSSQLKPFHSRILRTWVQGLAAEDPHHKRDKKRAAGDANDAPAAKKHSNAPPSAEIKEQEGTKHIAKEDEDEDEKEEDEDKDDTGDGICPSIAPKMLTFLDHKGKVNRLTIELIMVVHLVKHLKAGGTALPRNL
jgi:hypothetical protein